MQAHKLINLIGGDDLFINVQLIDQDRQPYDIKSLKEIKWLLHNAKGEIVPIETVIRAIDSAAGKITVWLPHQETTKLAGGVYTEWLRINCGDAISTLLTGPINVTADPWRAPIAEFEPLIARHVTADVVIVLNEKERIKRRPIVAEDSVEKRGPARVLPLRMSR